MRRFAAAAAKAEDMLAQLHRDLGISVEHVAAETLGDRTIV
ncbi:MAG TPA: hypothetical protein VEI57_09950 [Nitrospirota bacterium]|nr:hypothetical protein [Nitrospirota bacterium]